MSKFIPHLKTVLPKQRVERHWVNVNGKRKMMPASWKQITPVVGAFVDINNLATESNNCHTPQNTSDLTWKCIKSKCIEGGLAAFAEFNYSHCPINDGSECTGLNSVLHPKVLISKPDLGADVQGVQITEIYGETPKTRGEEDVQGVQAVQGKEPICEKTTPLANQNYSEVSGRNLEVCPVHSARDCTPTANLSVQASLTSNLTIEVGCTAKLNWEGSPHNGKKGIVTEIELKAGEATIQCEFPAYPLSFPIDKLVRCKSE